IAVGGEKHVVIAYRQPENALGVGVPDGFRSCIRENFNQSSAPGSKLQKRHLGHLRRRPVETWGPGFSRRSLSLGRRLGVRRGRDRDGCGATARNAWRGGQ